MLKFLAKNRFNIVDSIGLCMAWVCVFNKDFVAALVITVVSLVLSTIVAYFAKETENESNC